MAGDRDQRRGKEEERRLGRARGKRPQSSTRDENPISFLTPARGCVCIGLDGTGRRGSRCSFAGSEACNSLEHVGRDRLIRDSVSRRRVNVDRWTKGFRINSRAAASFNRCVPPRNANIYAKRTPSSGKQPIAPSNHTPGRMRPSRRAFAFGLINSAPRLSSVHQLRASSMISPLPAREAQAIIAIRGQRCVAGAQINRRIRLLSRVTFLPFIRTINPGDGPSRRGFTIQRTAALLGSLNPSCTLGFAPGVLPLTRTSSPTCCDP